MSAAATRRCPPPGRPAPPRPAAAGGASDRSGRTDRPDRAALEAARGGTVRDLVAPGLRVLLCGVNPSLWSAWAGLHFARPSNRLWAALAGSGLVPRRLHPAETGALLEAGVGVTNLVARATARADELDDDELREGLEGVRGLAERWRPGCVAVLGLTAYRVASGDRRAGVGARPERLGPSRVWLLPNPSGLNAAYQQPALDAAYADLRRALDGEVVPDAWR